MTNALNRVAQACAQKITKDIKSNHSKITKALPSELSALDKTLLSFRTSNLLQVKNWYETAASKTEELLDKIQSIKFVLVPQKLNIFQRFIRLFKVSLKHSISRVEAQEKIVADKLARIQSEQKLVQEKVDSMEKKQEKVAHLTSCIDTVEMLEKLQAEKVEVETLEKDLAVLKDESKSKEAELSEEQVIFANFRVSMMNIENQLNDLALEIKDQPENEALKNQRKALEELKEKATQECKAQAEKVEQLEKALEESCAKLEKMRDEFEAIDIEAIDEKLAKGKKALEDLGLHEDECDRANLEAELEQTQAEFDIAFRG